MELFVAICLEPEQAQALSDFTRRALAEHPAEHPADLHLTLHYLGHTDEVNQIAQRLSTVAADPFDLRFGRMDAFDRREVPGSVLWQGVEEEPWLRSLRDAVARALAGGDFTPETGFTPHITLSYTDRTFDREALRAVDTPLTGMVWHVSAFQLCQVLPGPQKPAFRRIASYRLSRRDRSAVRLLCINDFHGVLQENSSDLGAAKLVTAVKSYRAAYPDTAVLFGGDNCFGEPVSDLFGGKPVLDMMAALNTRATVLGNHDLDSSVEQVRTWSGYGGFPLLAANLEDRSGGQPDFVQPYTVLELGGFRIGVLGLSTVEELPGPDHPADWDVYRLTDPAAAARRYASLLGEEKRSGRLDAVIALTHLGLKDRQDGTFEGEEAFAAAAVPGLDGMFTAHYHRFLQRIIGQTPVVQGGCRGQGFSVLCLTFDDTRRLLSVVPLAYDLRSSRAVLTADREMASVLERYDREAAPVLGQELFTAAEDIHNINMAEFSLPITGTPLSKLATDVMRQAGGCEIALIYAGRVGGQGFSKGPVTRRDFYRAYPFANVLVTTEMTGVEIWENVNIGMRTLHADGASPLAVGGLIVTLDPSRPNGRRVLSIRTEDGAPLDPDRRYSVAIEDYLASNPFGFHFPEGERLTYHPETVRGLMLDYFTRTKVLYDRYPTNIILEHKG